MRNIFTLETFKKSLFTIILLELFLGGTGRLTEITPFLTLRMCLFLIYILIIAAYLIANYKLPLEIVGLTVFFLVVNGIGLANGYINSASSGDIFEDIKPLLNVFLLCYLSFTIENSSDIKYVLKLLKISALILALFHFVLFYIILKYQDIAILYAALNSDDSSSTNFFFKGDSGFVNYPGDIYLCVGFIVWDQYHKNSIIKYIALFSLMIAIVLTGTRGLIVGLAGAYLIKWLFLKFNYRSLVYMAIGALAFAGIFLQIKDNIGDKDESDNIRYEQINEVKERITPISIFLGHGYGIGVPVRPVHMEISYLEIFHKQGILGLFYYIAILVVAYLAYKKCSFNNGVGFYMFVIFIFILSATNPYINHPLGITVISIAIVCMLKISKLEKDKEVFLYNNN